MNQNPESEHLNLEIANLKIDLSSTALVSRDDGLSPGQLSPDGSWVDLQGIKHYPYGATYKPAEVDRRKKAGGAYSGAHQDVVKFSQEEIDKNPWLALSPRDYETLLLYMGGKSRREIATELQISEMTVTTRIAKPAMKRCMAMVKDTYEDDIHSLTALAVEAVRDCLTDEESKPLRLQAARDVLKATGRDKKIESGQATATSDMHKLLAAMKIDININQG